MWVSPSFHGSQKPNKRTMAYSSHTERATLWGTSLGVSNRAVGTGLYAIWESLSVPENGLDYTPVPLHIIRRFVSRKSIAKESDVRRVCDYATQSTLPRGYVLLMHLHRITDDPYSDNAAAHGT